MVALLLILSFWKFYIKASVCICVLQALRSCAEGYAPEVPVQPMESPFVGAGERPVYSGQRLPQAYRGPLQGCQGEQEVHGRG